MTGLAVERKTTIPFGERTYPVVELKATGSKGGGKFEALVAVFDNVDAYLDRIRKGAFVDTLKAPPEGRGYPPVVWSHLWGIVPIGASMRAEEAEGVKTDKGTFDGLYISAELLVDEHQTAREVYAAMRQKGGDGLPPLREFSFGYRVRDFEMVSETPTLDDGTEAEPIEIRELLKLDLYEVGPTLVGANDATALLGVKSALAAGVGQELADLIHKGLPPQPDPGKTDPDVGTGPTTDEVNELLGLAPR